MQTEMFKFLSSHDDISISNGAVVEAGFSVGSQFPIIDKDAVFVEIIAGNYRFKIPRAKGIIKKD